MGQQRAEQHDYYSCSACVAACGLAINESNPRSGAGPVCFWHCSSRRRNVTGEWEAVSAASVQHPQRQS
jgi:hypothetical protein